MSELNSSLKQREAEFAAEAERVNGGRKPKFGDRMLNPWASEENPHRIGMFVREGRNTGRVNPGRWYEFTDGKGEFWQARAQFAQFVERATPAPQAAPSEPVGKVFGHLCRLRNDRSMPPFLLFGGMDAQRRAELLKDHDVAAITDAVFNAPLAAQQSPADARDAARLYRAAPRGIGCDYTPGCMCCGGEKGLYNNISFFVPSRETGEAIVALFKHGARLDWRDFEPQHIQVKVGACDLHLSNLQLLEKAVREGPKEADSTCISSNIIDAAIAAATTSTEGGDG